MVSVSPKVGGVATAERPEASRLACALIAFRRLLWLVKRLYWRVYRFGQNCLVRFTLRVRHGASL